MAQVGSHRVVMFSPAGKLLAQWGDSGGFVSFSHPTGIALNDEGNVYGADFGANRIDKMSATGQRLAV